jgi:hypothetical protein
VTIAAKKLGKPIKMQLDRITDMEMYGKEIVACTCIPRLRPPTFLGTALSVLEIVTSPATTDE